ncbi:hypothetical protein JXJ21_05015 [candidate division KSB1 bacterium]|nr:hypothetical protein [candidate division KSB1 bacterium]
MDTNYSKLGELLKEKLHAPAVNFVVIDASGSIIHDNFDELPDKPKITNLTKNVVRAAWQMAQGTEKKLLESMTIQGDKAFLLFILSNDNIHYYVVYRANGLTLTMTKLCVQNSISQFESKLVPQR